MLRKTGDVPRDRTVVVAVVDDDDSVFVSSYEFGWVKVPARTRQISFKN